jgi:hypothetical protein
MPICISLTQPSPLLPSYIFATTYPFHGHGSPPLTVLRPPNQQQAAAGSSRQQQAAAAVVVGLTKSAAAEAVHQIRKYVSNAADSFRFFVSTSPCACARYLRGSFYAHPP